MKTLKKIIDNVKVFLVSLAEKIKKAALKLKQQLLVLFNKVKNSPRMVKTVLVYGVVLVMMFSFMAWQRSRLPSNIITNNPPVETPSGTEDGPDEIERDRTDEENSEGELDEETHIEPEEEVETVFNINDKIIWPIDGFREIEGKFREMFYFRNGGDEYFLDGILIPAPKGSKVRAALPGVVSDVNESYLYGKVVKIKYIDPNNDIWECFYYNLEQIQVEEGQTISLGDSIGYVSSNLLASDFKEEHLVFELKKNGIEVDPEPYF